MDNLNKSVLVIEDDQMLQKALREKLTREGFTVLSANDGEEGLVTALAHHPDVITLDLLMPVMNGLVMLKKLREDPWGRNVKVIILSNLDDSATISEALNEQSSRYLIKSDSNLEMIVADIKMLLGLEKRAN